MGMRNDDAVVVMMAPDRCADDGGVGADPAKAVAPLIAARVIAQSVPAVIVPAIAAVLNRLHGR
jgi:hypothetical protein